MGQRQGYHVSISVMKLTEGVVEKYFKFVSKRNLTGSDIGAILVLLLYIGGFCYIQQYHQTFVATDVIVHYFPAAQKVLEGYGYHAFEMDHRRGPGYPLMVAGITYLLDGDMFMAGKVISVVSVAVFLLFAYLLLRRVFNSITALAAVMMTMGVNQFVWASCWNGLDIPFVCLVMVSLYFTARSEKITQLDTILAGLFSGLALTIRWNGVLLPILFLARIVIVPRRRHDLRSRIWLIVVYGIGFLITSGPWLYVNYLLHGSPLYNEGTIVLDPLILPKVGSWSVSQLNIIAQDFFGLILRFMTKSINSFPTVIRGFHSFRASWGWVMAGPFWIFILFGCLLLLPRIDRLKIWFLGISCIWYASLIPFEVWTRFYILLVPFFSALAVFIVTSGALPDIYFEINKKRWARFYFGYLLDRKRQSKSSSELVTNRTGFSFLSLILICVLAVTSYSTISHVQQGYKLREDNSFYHELSQFINQMKGQGTIRPIGAREYSQARYWIPYWTGTIVITLPSYEYEAIFPDLSYILYDQLEGDILYENSDDPDLKNLFYPLFSPPFLEPVYYKPNPPRAILYKILKSNDQMEIISASASSILMDTSPTHAFDKAEQTWWSSVPHLSDDTPEWITFDLGSPKLINRIWLLPRSGGHAFPEDIRVDLSQDGYSWQEVVEVTQMPKPIQQNPQVISFPEMNARFVRIVTTQLRWDNRESGYMVSLAEVRVSLAVEYPVESPEFSLSPSDIYYDPISNELVAKVINLGEGFGHANVEFREGWAAENTEYLGLVETQINETYGVGFARLSLDEEYPLKPGDCLPIWVSFQPFPFSGLALNSYSSEYSMPQLVYSLVCVPQEIVIDNFDYIESPLDRGWVVSDDQIETASVTTTFDQELNKRVMMVTSEAEDGLPIRRWMRVNDRPQLSLLIKSSSDFVIYMQVRDLDGEHYFIQYMPYPKTDLSQGFPEGDYIYYELGSYFVDGEWHQLERDVYKDFFSVTGIEVDYIESIVIRAYKDLELADLTLSTGQ